VKAEDAGWLPFGSNKRPTGPSNGSAKSRPWPIARTVVGKVHASAKLGAWSAHGLAPIVNHTLEGFGPDHVMFGGDWPGCTLAASYRQWVEALKSIVAARSEAEQRKLFHLAAPVDQDSPGCSNAACPNRATGFPQPAPPPLESRLCRRGVALALCSPLSPLASLLRLRKSGWRFEHHLEQSSKTARIRLSR
jgi:hypothetical protein